MITVNAAIVGKKAIAEKTNEVTFYVGNDFTFVAGEYITVTLPQLKDLPMRDQFRDFSIASSPLALPHLSITYRDGESPFKRCLSNLLPGDSVHINGPKGVFTLPETGGTVLAFIAGGVGITPFISMIRFILSSQKKYPVHLYYFNHARETAPYFGELEKYQGEISFFPIFHPVSSEQIPNEELKNTGVLWYVAGPSGMVTASMAILRENGVEDRQIKTEEFTGYE